MFGLDYRPKTFAEIKGQKTTIKAVKNYLKKNLYPQASIFLGASGNGKSTMARLVAKTLNCEHPIFTEDGIEPCCQCASCKDVEQERFQFGVQCYESVNLTIDKIREIEENISYLPLGAKNNVIIIEEAQNVPTVAYKSFLTLIEKKYKNTYFILTSTDVSKFNGSSWSNDNKEQEKIATKSRLIKFFIKPSQMTDIEEYLFSILCKIDPDEKLPSSIEDLITYISTISRGNLRDALNSFGECIDAEIYTREEAIDLWNTEDEVKDYELLYQLANKSSEVLTFIQKNNDLKTKFYYWTKILADVALRSMVSSPYEEKWREDNAQKIIMTNNLKPLLDCFTKTCIECGSYFNNSIFVKNLMIYYSAHSLPSPEVKKVKKVKLGAD